MKKEEIKLLLTFLVLLALIIITGMSCNPVKRVLKDNKKFEIVAKEVVKRGYCINDTIIIDSTIHDTIYSEKTIIDSFPVEKLRNIDTILKSGIKLSIKDGVVIAQCPPIKAETIIKTKTSYIRDLKLESILKASNDSFLQACKKKDGYIADLNIINKEKSVTIREWMLRFWSLFVGVCVSLGLIAYFKFRK